MIESKELRIGNWVELENHVCALNKTTFKAILLGNYKSLNPIPITEEWLLKFGFRKMKSTFFIDRSKELGHTFGNVSISIYFHLFDYMTVLQFYHVN